MNEFDIVVIGSGMGGLVCADLLGKEGYRVGVLEKNKQIGGCLQTYARDKTLFDSGVHYLGGLAPGQNLYQVFKYLGILGKLKLQRMDEDAFDRIIFEGDNNEYPYAQGYENFIRQLLHYFPSEEKALRLYCDKIKEVCSKFPLYNLRSGGDLNEKTSVLEIDTRSFIESITNNKKLQEVLVGNNMLYVLQSYKTPFYVHAMIMNSYIESSWKCLDGGSAIAKYLAQNIRAQGGQVIRHAEVKKIVVENDRASAVQLIDGSLVHGKNFISNLHPALTLDMIESDLIKNVYKNRINALENSIGGFVVNIVLKENTVKYSKANYYYHKDGFTWKPTAHTADNWPVAYSVFLSAGAGSGDYATAMTILTYMRYDEVAKWADSFNTVSVEAERGEEYRLFKEAKAEKLIDLVQEKFPGLRSCIKACYTATPLTYRDYTASPGGSMYGIVKDYQNPLKTFISARTKVPNLYLTGQNLNLHGILGATMSGLVTCVALLGNENIIEKVRNA